MEVDSDANEEDSQKHPKEFCPIVTEWAKKHEEGRFSSTTLKAHWREEVPKWFSPRSQQNSLNYTFDAHHAESNLFLPMEQFICHSPDPEPVLQRIKMADKPSSLCGKVFKNGEPTYSCRDCAIDATCVLCINCFTSSAHKNHKYRMYTSAGGGYCDCGDVEAWKCDPFCSVHIKGKGSTSESTEAIQGKLDRDTYSRAVIIFSSVLRYCYHILTHELGLPSFPSELAILEDNSDEGSLRTIFATVVYNDESHGFEQVIQSLKKAIDCDHKDAMEITTMIDREGRGILRCDEFTACMNAKKSVEKSMSLHASNVRPFRVDVIEGKLLAHQTFALRLLSWMQRIMDYSVAFRHIFSEVVMEPMNDERRETMVERICLKNTSLWKTARVLWQHLFIAGMLMDYDKKKIFATVFTKHYSELMRDFANDDHDHAVSIMGLTVQIYTVPTIAHVLIGDHNVLAEIFRTIMGHLKMKPGDSTSLQSGPLLTRTLYTTYDLKYLLTVKPEPAEFDIRVNMQKGFFHGFSTFIELLSSMQGMDHVVRQVGAHLEFEPEWSAGFNVHIKLEPVISLIIEWCGINRNLFIKCYRATLRALQTKYSKELRNPCVVKELANHSASCIDYDVTTKPVSIHLPLSRLFAGLHLHLEKFNLNYDSTEFSVKDKLTPTQLLEPVLRTCVMVAQVQAGMWRRNGHSLFNQVYFYHNIRCRKEMLDKDIVMLQAIASLIPSDDFLVHMLNKFGLYKWAKEDYEDKDIPLKSSEQDCVTHRVSLIEEFLCLLITIISERFTPGVGKVTPRDCIKKEVVQQLCVEPLPRSQLLKVLPGDLTEEGSIDDIINEVANFVKPTSASTKGFYHLKEEYYSTYNVFFYHYTKEQQSKSEETKRKRNKEGKDCCTPPPLIPLSNAFKMLSNLTQCDVMLHLMKIILERCENLKVKTFSETIFREILFIIGLALWEEEQCLQDSDPFVNFTIRAASFGIYERLKALVGSLRIESHKDLLAWTVMKYDKVVSLQKGKKDVDMSSSVSDQDQREQRLKKKRQMEAEKRRQRIMSQMAKAQVSFLQQNSVLFDVTTTTSNSEPSEMEVDVRTDISDCTVQRVALGPQQSTRLPEQFCFTCILCQEDQTISLEAPAMVLSAYVQNSTVLSQTKKLECPPCTDFPYLLSSNLKQGVHSSSCGHVMHAGCWQKHFDQIVAKESSFRFRHYHTSYNVDKKEFLCPLCECLSNTVLPVMPPLLTTQPEPTIPLSLSSWIKFAIHFSDLMKMSDSSESTDLSEAAHHRVKSVGSVDEILTTCRDSEAIRRTLARYDPPVSISNSLSDMINYFAQCAFTVGMNELPDERNPRVISVVWESVAYTTHATEWLLREQGKALMGELPVRQRDALQSLVRIAASLPTYSILKHIVKLYFVAIVRMFLEKSSKDCFVLGVDAGSLLVSLVFSSHGIVSEDESRNEYPSMPSGDNKDLMNTSLVFLLHVVQILLSRNFSEISKDDEMSESPSQEAVALHEFFVSTCSNCMERVPEITPQALYVMVMEASVPWLRFASLFWHFVTGVVPPAELNEPGGDSYPALLGYLGLSDFFTTNFDEEVRELATRWFHKGYSSMSKRCAPPILYPIIPRKLVVLPDHYSEVLNKTSFFVCPSKDSDDSVSPAMCLLCGVLLCSQNYCCPVTTQDGKYIGPCTHHASTCGAGVGIFLRIRECRLLLLVPGHRGCFLPAPYVDDYGEPDTKLKRGDPLHLCAENYRSLYLRWLQHRIPEEVVRAMENLGMHHPLPQQEFQYF